MTVRYGDLRLRWLGYATARLDDGGTVVYTDPGRYGVLTGGWSPPTADPTGHPAGPPYDARDGDVVVVTHDHHYDPDGVDRVAAPDATLVVYEGVDAARAGREPAPEDLGREVVRVGERERVTVDGVGVGSVPAYNDPDGPHCRPSGEPYHPRGFGVGYLVELGGETVLWPGDTDVVPEQEALDVSVLLANVSGSVAMDRHGAAALAETLDPGLVCPIHYDTQEFLRADAGAFAADVARRGVPVVLDEGWG
ncbi:MAG: MBL fold metallo-hydrolase [Haloferacaceae archaeon]